MGEGCWPAIGVITAEEKKRQATLVDGLGNRLDTLATEIYVDNGKIEDGCFS